jgi:methionyl aminopeptidase
MEGKKCEGCGSPAKLQCPTCLKLLLPSSFFCGQECFKANWNVHKLKHTVPKDLNKYTGPLRKGKVSAMRSVPDHIDKPDYAVSGIPVSEQNSRVDREIPVYSDEELDKIRHSSLLVRRALDLCNSMIRPGVTPEEIDIAVHEFCIENNSYPSPLNYHHFPKSLCTSVNEVICHGIPDDRPLENGDIVNCDVSIYCRGFHGDANETYLVGDVDDASKNLVKSTYEALMLAIDHVRPGVKYSEMGNIISRYVEPKGYSVVKSYTGHGVGRLFHCAPSVPHYSNNKARGVMRTGHVFTIEPMINAGAYKDELWDDNWTSVTQDGRRSAQFEHTMMVTPNGVEVMTARLPTSPPLACLL